MKVLRDAGMLAVLKGEGTFDPVKGTAHPHIWNIVSGTGHNTSREGHIRSRDAQGFGGIMKNYTQGHQ